MSVPIVHVLLIEDNPGDARLVQIALADPNVAPQVRLTHVERLSQGLQVLESAAASAQPLDAVLLDLSLPDSSGSDTFFRMSQRARQVPVILLTGNADDELAQSLMRAGAQDYLLKGDVDGRILKRSIRYAIDRKNSADSLRASEERYRTLVEQASDGIFILDLKGVVVDINTSGSLLLGVSAKEFLARGVNVRELIVTPDVPEELSQVSALVQGQTLVFEAEIRHAGGQLLPVEVSAKKLEDGRLQGLVRDISERKKAETVLREANEFNMTLIKTLPFQMDIVDESGRIIYVNPLVEKMIGRELLGRYCWETYPDNQEKCKDCPLQRPIEIGETIVTRSSRMMNGRIFDVTHTGMLYQGRRALLKVFQDVTENRRMDEQLHSTLQQLKFHMENSPLALIEFDSHYHIQRWSDRAEHIFGWSEAEVLGKGINDIRWVYEEDSPAVNSDIDELLQARRTSNIQTNRNYRKDGTVIVCEWYSSAMIDTDGKMISIQCLVLDVTERKQAERNLRESEAFGQALLYNSPIGIAVRDPQGRLLTANQAWQNIWATPDYLMVGDIQQVNDRAEFERDNPTLAAHFDAVVEVFTKGGNLHFPELRNIHGRPGAAEWVSQHFYAILDESGQVSKVVVLTEDITERKRSEVALLKAHAELEQRVIDRTVELKTANMELEKAARMKDEFLASMSHELRTPLTGILGLSEALQMVTYGNLSDKQLKALKNIESSGRHLLSLINDMLDLSKIEAGMFEMQFAPTSLDAICQSSLQLVRGLANQKHQNISYSIQPPAIVLRADPRRLKQMLVNLLGNAVKFTPEDGQLGIEVAGMPGNRQVRITVWDNGIGIRDEDLARLFKPFVQLDSSLARNYSGTGLGLSLVKRMAELQGGEISVESAYGIGSRFTILLPWVVDATQPLQFYRRVSDRMQRAMTIDQDLDKAVRLTSLLKTVGLQNQVVLKTFTALDTVVQTWPDVIFLRESAGLNIEEDLLSRLKADPRTQDIPVIVLSRNDHRSDQGKSLADGFLLEPFAQNELHAELQRLAFRSPAVPAEPSAGLSVSDKPVREKLAVLLVDDNPMLTELVADYLRGQNMQVNSVSNGWQMLESVELLQPDILLVDIQMPGMSGIEVIATIRKNKNERISSLPIIAITALAMSGDRERCLEAGANEYMSKPLELMELALTIQALCRTGDHFG
jgi:PAS domain S-box-containing protein